MITAKGYVRYCEMLFRAGAVYLWGGDGEIITKELLEKKKKKFGAKYYKDIDLSIHEGRIGMDCNGMNTFPSGMNITSAEQYEKCIKKGKIGGINRNVVCLVFREEGGKIVHVGSYLGDGRVMEMYDDAEIRKFNKTEWTYYGIPSWIDYSVEPVKEETELKVPFVIKVKEKNVPLYSAPDCSKVARVIPAPNKYTIVELRNGVFGKFKSGAGWFDLSMKETYEICK